jgi:replication factor A1
MKVITLKNGETKEKRTIHIKDDSGYSIDVTLWGDFAANIELARGSIVIFQDVRVKTFNGKTLTFIGNSKVILKIPDHPRYKELLTYKNSDRSLKDNVKNLGDSSPAPTIKFIKIKQLVKECSVLEENHENFKLYFTSLAHLTKIGSSLFYDSCDNDGCMKKVFANSVGTYECERCHKTLEKPKTRFMASLKFSDDSGSIFVIATGEDLCQYIFKRSVDEIRSLQETDQRAFNEFLQESLFEEYRIRLIAKKDSYNSDEKVKYQLIKIIPIMLGPQTYFQTLLNILEA